MRMPTETAQAPTADENLTLAAESCYRIAHFWARVRWKYNINEVIVTILTQALKLATMEFSADERATLLKAVFEQDC